MESCTISVTYNVENRTLAPFLDNSVNEEFNFPEASIIFPSYLYFKTFSSLIPLRKNSCLI
jgi:hypothetical protein